MLSQVFLSKTPFSIKEDGITGAVMKKTALTLTFILTLLVSTLAGAKLVDWAIANPFPYTHCDSSFVTVSLLSPENKTYDTNRILVTIFAGAYPGVMGVGYRVDGGPFTELAPEMWDGHTFNVSVWLNGLSKGSHNIEARATTWEAPNGILTASSQVNFTITKVLETQSPSPVPTVAPTSAPVTEPFPTALVIGSVIAVVVIETGSLVYFKKRKR